MPGIRIIPFTVSIHKFVVSFVGQRAVMDVRNQGWNQYKNARRGKESLKAGKAMGRSSASGGLLTPQVS